MPIKSEDFSEDDKTKKKKEEKRKIYVLYSEHFFLYT